MKASKIEAAVFAAALFLGLSACSRVPSKPEAGPPGYPFPAREIGVFLTLPTGLLAVAKESPVDTALFIPVPGALAVRAAALAASEDSATGTASIFIAMNRFGTARLEVKPKDPGDEPVDGAYRLEQRCLPEIFGSLSVGGLWNKPGLSNRPGLPDRPSSYLLQLYRDPFVDDPEPRKPGNANLFAIDGTGEMAALAPLAENGDLFALYHPAADSWLAELRLESADKVQTSYISLADLSVQGTAPKETSRASFENSLKPCPLAAAPAALQIAAEALGTEPLLIHARGLDGLDGYWLSGGRPEDAREAVAWLGTRGEPALVLGQDGRGAFAASDMVDAKANSGGARTFTIQAPAKDANFTAVAALFGESRGARGGNGLAVAAWEKSSFPLIEAAGILVFPIP